MAKKTSSEPDIVSREFKTPEEIDIAIQKIERRIREFEQLEGKLSAEDDTGAETVAISNFCDTVRSVFGPQSHEFQEHQDTQMYSGPLYTDMPDQEYVLGKDRGRTRIIGILGGLIERLQEKKADLRIEGSTPAPSTYFDRLNLHPRILDVCRDLFMDGHHWPAVFDASKALVNYVKERSGRHDLDGANLMRTVFSRRHPTLAFNDLSDQTDEDEQEGLMHLYEGVVLGVRNPGGHSFPEGSEQRAIEYISLISLLAYRVEETKRIRSNVNQEPTA